MARYPFPRMRRLVPLALASLTLLAPLVCTRPSLAASAAAICTASKLKTVGKGAFGKLKCVSKATKKGVPVDPGCLTKNDEKLTKKFAKAHARGGCLTSADPSASIAAIDDLVADAEAALTTGLSPGERRCAAGKVKEVGKKALKSLACHAKAAKSEDLVDPSCLAKAKTRFIDKFATIETQGPCLTTDDAEAVCLDVDQLESDVVELLVVTCGDEVLAPAEICDGDNDDLCPGGCLPDCTCPSSCGDGSVDGAEECDDGGNIDADGCSANCLLEDAANRCTGVPAFPGADLDTELVVDGLTAPVFVTAPPLDPSRLFIVQQDGRIRVLRGGTLSTFLDISSKVTFGGERGLLSMAFHPDYESNGIFFVNYTGTQCNGVGGCDTVIARYQITDADTADPSSEIVLLAIDQDFANHNGGQIQFGPDGMLYVAMGDGGSGGDPNNRAQDDGQLLGKMLRIDVDEGTPPFFAVPSDNPNPGAGVPLGLIWTKGLRNPWRFTFDRATGDLYIGDVGQNTTEEIDVEEAGSLGGSNYGSGAGGANWGWRLLEGPSCFNPPVACDPLMETTLPVLDFAHTDPGSPCSVTGGYVYRGCALPDIDGSYFYSDFCASFLRTFDYIGGGVIQNEQDRTADLAPSGGGTINQVSSFGEDARGELYIADIGGEIYRLVPQP